MAIFHIHVQGRMNSTAHHDNKLLKWKKQVRTAKNPEELLYLYLCWPKLKMLNAYWIYWSSWIVTWQGEEGGSPAPLGTGSCCPRRQGGCGWCCSAFVSPGQWLLELRLLGLLGASCLCSGTTLPTLLYNSAEIQNWTPSMCVIELFKKILCRLSLDKTV